MSITVQTKLGYLDKVNFDFSEILMKSGEIVASEMRGNILRGVDVRQSPLRALSPAYARWKSGSKPVGIRKVNLQAGGFVHPVGHTKPLIAQNRSLVSPSSYSVKKTGPRAVQVGFKGQHPIARMSIGQLAFIHNHGTAKIPRREFAGITEYAVKRIVAMIDRYYRDIFK